MVKIKNDKIYIIIVYYLISFISYSNSALDKS